ncbi:GIY-YIG catalytic domain-containing endonuclease [Acanthocystis turfacea Chlorella virus NTS-1]|nr:GIY-YIG catalytic domain-containing endonuclease [Acanthocystis turfacea Chlorella virus NTS-1]
MTHSYNANANMGFIYMLTSPYGKSYIGQTIRPIEERLKEHQLPSSNCVAIYNAIKLHGWDNFEKHWYEVPDEDLNEHEELMVEVLGTLAPGGYNLKEGGGSGGKMSEEVKKKMSESRKDEKHYNYGKTQPDEVKQKISIKLKGRTLDDEVKQKMSEAQKGRTFSDEHRQNLSETQKGRIMSDDHKQNLSESHKGEKNQNSKKVYQYDLNGTFVQSFASGGDAARSLNKNPGSSIGECARGERKTAYGFKWSYMEL